MATLIYTPEGAFWITNCILGGFHWAMFAWKACLPATSGICWGLRQPVSPSQPHPTSDSSDLAPSCCAKVGPAAFPHSVLCDSVEAGGHFPPPHPHSHSNGQLTGFLALDPHPPGLCLE